MRVTLFQARCRVDQSKNGALIEIRFFDETGSEVCLYVESEEQRHRAIQSHLECAAALELLRIPEENEG